MSLRRLVRACLSCLLAAGFLLACADLNTVVVPPRSPAIYLHPLFQWHTVHPGHQDALAVPTTAKRPGPSISVPMTHEAGVGTPIKGTDALSLASASGQHVMATELAQMNAAGWQALYSPTVTGSFSQYVLYSTLQSGSHYCFVEFSAAALTPQEASQQLDVYHN